MIITLITGPKPSRNHESCYLLYLIPLIWNSTLQTKHHPKQPNQQNVRLRGYAGACSLTSKSTFRSEYSWSIVSNGSQDTTYQHTGAFSRLIGGWKLWNFLKRKVMCVFCWGLGFLVGNENYSLIETEGNKHLCVLTTKLSTFKHPVFSSSAGGFYRCFGKIRARFYSVLKKVECCWVRSWLKKAKLKLRKIRRLFVGVHLP